MQAGVRNVAGELHCYSAVRTAGQVPAEGMNAQMNSVMQPARQVPVIADVDVCVIGGGPSGLPAAIAAARQGASVLLVEMHGFFGGMATAGFVGPILGHTASRSDIPAIGGIPREMCERMAGIGHAVEWEKSLKNWGVAFTAEGYKIIADRMVREAGVRTLFHCFFVDSVVEAGRMTHAIVESKSGRQAISAKVFVDATGDADAAYRAGAECTKGRPADGRPMSMGSMFHIGGVDKVPTEAKQTAVAKLREAVQAGELNLYGCGMGGHGSTLRPHEGSVNMTRFAGDCTDVEVLTEGEFATRDMTWRSLEIFRSVPGCEGLYIAATPAHVGLRESRQLVGLARITGEDAVKANKYEDSIARCGYWIDIHCPRGLVDGGAVHLCSVNCTKTDCYMLTEYADQLPDELYPPDGDWFDIPYRCLVPEKIDGLLVCGRCISADYQAMSAMRVMGPCMATGQAAGTAAAMAALAQIRPRSVDVPTLRETLAATGALI